MLKKFNIYQHPSVVEAILLAAIEQGFPVSVSGANVVSSLRGDYNEKKYLHFHFRDSGADVYQNGVDIGYHVFEGNSVVFGQYCMNQTFVDFIQDFSTTPAKEVVSNWVNTQIQKLQKGEGYWKNHFYTALIKELYK